MGRRLLEAGHDLAVWNRTAERALPLKERGATVTRTPRDAAQNAAIVLSSLKDDEAICEVALGEDGILRGLQDGAVHCDTSTISPSVAFDLSQSYHNSNRFFVHCPVLGSRRQIAEGALLMFAAGPAEAVDTLEPVLSLLGKRTWRFEQPSAAASLKLACNMLIVSMICGFSQSLAFARKSGLDPALFTEVIQSSALASPMYASKARQIMEGDWSANFIVNNIIKDIDLALAAGDTENVPQPMLAMMRQFFAAASASGYAEEDYSAVSKVFARLAGVDPEASAGGE